MVDLSLRYVAPSDADTGAAVPSATGGRPLIGLSLGQPENLSTASAGPADSKRHEGGHELRVSVLGSAGTSVTDIDVHDGPGQGATARLEVTGPRGLSVIEVQVGQGSTISLRIGRPRRAEPGPSLGVVPLKAAGHAPDGRHHLMDDDALRPAVPEQFRRAFDSKQTPLRGDD